MGGSRKPEKRTEMKSATIRKVKMIGSCARRSTSTVIIAAFFLCSAASGFAADKIRISGGGMTPLHSIIWVANQEGMFKKYGIEAEYLVMNSGTLGVQTLLSNESQFLFSTGTLAIKKHKMNLLLDMAEAGMPFPQSCLMIKRSYLDANREKAANVVKALIEGLFLAKRDKALMIQVMKKYI